VIVDTRALAEIVKDSGLSYKSNSKSWIFTCPKCSKKEKLYIRKSDGRFVCWSCQDKGFWGRAEHALHALLGLSIEELRKRLYGGDQSDGTAPLRLDLSAFLDSDEEVAEALPEKLLHPDFIPIAEPGAERGRMYLRGRGIPTEVAKEYGLQYWAARSRVVFPIVMNGKVYGWEARATGPTEFLNENGEKVTIPKTLGLPGMRKDLMLMFADRLKGAEHAVVCEGAVDAIKAHFCGGNVATMGKNVSKEKLDLIRSTGVRRIYVALDPDAAKDISKMVKAYGDLEVYHLRPSAGHKDLGEMSFEDVYEQFLSARRVNAGNVFVHVRVPKVYSVRPQVAPRDTSGVGTDSGTVSDLQ